MLHNLPSGRCKLLRLRTRQTGMDRNRHGHWPEDKKKMTDWWRSYNYHKTRSYTYHILQAQKIPYLPAHLLTHTEVSSDLLDVRIWRANSLLTCRLLWNCFCLSRFVTSLKYWVNQSPGVLTHPIMRAYGTDDETLQLLVLGLMQFCLPYTAPWHSFTSFTLERYYSID